MKNHLRVLIACVALLANCGQSFANFAMSPSGATTAFAIDAANQGTSLCAAASTECPATVLVNTAGAPIGVAAVPLQVSIANTGANATAVLVNQPTAANLNATVVGTVTANAGTNLNTSLLGTKANQDTNSATTAHTCSTAGYSELGCLGQIDDDVKGVGTIQGNVNVTPTDCSLALTTGATAQNIVTAGATLHGFTIANIDTTSGSGEPVWFSLTTTAAASTIASYPLAAPTATTFANLSSYTSPIGFGVNTSVSVVAATTGHKISCTKW